MSLTGWFRKHQRHMLVGVAVFLMIAWGIGPALRTMRTAPRSSAGAIRGERVTQAETMEARLSVEMVLRLGMLDFQRAFALRRLYPEARRDSLYLVLLSPFRSFVFPDGPRLSDDSVWRFLVLLREAEAADITWNSAEIEALLAGVFPDGKNLNASQYENYLLSRRFTDAAVTQRAGDIVKVLKLIALRRSAVLVSSAECWQIYCYRNERVRIKYVMLDGKQFEPLVEATEEQLQDFYQNYKDKFVGEGGSPYGYMAPRRVKVEYAMASVEEVKKDIKVTREEIDQYYRQHKADYGIAADTDSAAPVEISDAVREQIRVKLAAQKAEDEVTRRVDETLSQLRSVSERYGNGPQPLSQYARSHGLDYHVVRTESGRDLVSSQQLAQLAPGGEEMAKFAFAEGDEELYFPMKIARPGEFTLIYQVLERSEPETQTFAQVKEQVREDYVKVQGAEKAERFAEKLCDQARQTDMETAALEMGKRLKNLLQAVGQTQGQETLALEVKESEPFGRSAAPFPAVAESAFALEVGQVAVARAKPPSYRVYVFETTERMPASEEDFARSEEALRSGTLMLKQQRALNTWMGALLSRAHKEERKQG